jgi:hypothetical protein
VKQSAPIKKRINRNGRKTFSQNYHPSQIDCTTQVRYQLYHSKKRVLQAKGKIDSAARVADIIQKGKMKLGSNIGAIRPYLGLEGMKKACCSFTV